MKYIICSLALLLAGCVHTNVHTHANSGTYDDALEIRNVLDTQVEAWNAGNIDAFMAGYWKNEQLRFGSGGTIERGWQATLERYQRNYSSREAMGSLSFDDLDVQVFSNEAAVVHGRWKLKRAADTPGGLFTLVFRDFGDGWVIVSDTTTSGGAN